MFLWGQLGMTSLLSHRDWSWFMSWYHNRRACSNEGLWYLLPGFPVFRNPVAFSVFSRVTFIFFGWPSVKRRPASWPLSHTQHHIKTDWRVFGVCVHWRGCRGRGSQEGDTDNSFFNAVTSPSRFLLQSPAVTEASSQRITAAQFLCWLDQTMDLLARIHFSSNGG